MIIIIRKEKNPVKVKTMKYFLIGFLGLLAAGAALIITPNSFGDRIQEEARARGYREYSPDQAKKLAEARCTQCHQMDRIAKYCSRCGPPFIVVITHMDRLMKQHQEKNPGKKLLGLTKTQQLVVVQVWNALVGNWEKDFRKEDMVSMIGQGNDHLLALLDTPVDERKIENALAKTGHRLKGAYEAQKTF